MNHPNNIKLFAAPDAIRIFWGYKHEQVSHEQFNRDLGETFMPGTPAVLGPMGLNAYLPAVLDLQQPDQYPDEAALIVYPSLELYQAARADNLLGRIYTHSHSGVFDMTRSGGQWPGTVDNPKKHGTMERWAWRVMDKPLDWQLGHCRLLCLGSLTIDLVAHLADFSKNHFGELQRCGVEELIVQCTAKFATVWMYATEPSLNFDTASTHLISDGVVTLRDLLAEPFVMRHGNEKVNISGAKFIQFRFVREMKYYI